MKSTTHPEESQLLHRLADYESRGWLSSREVYHYRSLMNQHPRSGLSDRSILQQIASRLDDLVDRQHGYVPHLQTATTIATSPTSSTDRSLAQNDTSSGQMSWEDRSKNKSTEDTNDFSIADNLPLIMEPSGIWNTLSNRPSRRITESQLQEWFVEMCFFARLGFVQPPSCLKCIFRQVTQKSTSPSSCRNWVIWRRDASVLLHPTKLQGNIVLVQCRAASDLLSQKIVEGLSWDSEKRHLLRH